MAEFTRELYQLLGIKLAATTAYHPQGDGQTERVNQELEQYLRLFTNQRQDNTAGARYCFPWKNPFLDMCCGFQRVFPAETQRVFLKGKSEKHIMCFFQVSHR